MTDDRKNWTEALKDLRYAVEQLLHCQGLQANAIHILTDACSRMTCLAEEAKGDE
jgi:hypothetical protein